MTGAQPTICAQCSTPFVPERKYPVQRFCTVKCRQTFNNAKAALDLDKRRRQGRESHQRNKEYANAKRRNWALDHPEHTKASMKAWYEAHKEEEQPKHRAWHAAHKEEANRGRRERYQALTPEQVAAQSRRQEVKARQSFPWMKLLMAARGRAKKKGVPFTLTQEWAKEAWTGRCALTGLTFDMRMPGRSGPSQLAPSIDRIRPAEGYTPENCRFIVWALNAFKGEGTDAMMYGLAAMLLQVNAIGLEELER